MKSYEDIGAVLFLKEHTLIVPISFFAGTILRWFLNGFSWGIIGYFLVLLMMFVAAIVSVY